MRAPSSRRLAVFGFVLVAACHEGDPSLDGDPPQGQGDAATTHEPGSAADHDSAPGSSPGDTTSDGGTSVPTTFPGRTLTVSKDGKGQYTTIQAAVDAAEPGDGVVIRGGTYPESVTLKASGTEDEPITITTSPGETVIIEGAKKRPSKGNGLVRLDGVSNIQLIGLQVANSKNFGIYGTGVKNVTIRGGAVGYSQDGSIVLSDGSNVVVDGVDVHHSNDQGLSADHESISIINVDGFEVKNCHVHDGKEEGIDAKYEARNGKIHGNHVDANNGPNIYVDSAHDIEIFDNLVHGAKDESKSGIALAVENYSETKKCYGVKVYNNVVFDNPAAMTLWRESSGSFKDIVIANNTFYSNDASGGGGIINVGVPASAFSGTNAIRNNIFWKNSGRKEIDDGDGAMSKFSVDHNLFKTGTAGSVAGSDAVLTADPGFVDLSAGNVKLAAGSPAIDVGVGDLAPAKDYDGPSISAPSSAE